VDRAATAAHAALAPLEAVVAAGDHAALADAEVRLAGLAGARVCRVPGVVAVQSAVPDAVVAHERAAARVAAGANPDLGRGRVRAEGLAVPRHRRARPRLVTREVGDVDGVALVVGAARRARPLGAVARPREVVADGVAVEVGLDQMFRPFAVRDGNLVTGQQQFSGAEAARLVIEALGR
jgi:putative intracellular protease/amidase